MKTSLKVVFHKLLKGSVQRRSVGRVSVYDVWFLEAGGRTKVSGDVYDEVEELRLERDA
jgi:hypothetical protein